MWRLGRSVFLFTSAWLFLCQGPTSASGSYGLRDFGRAVSSTTVQLGVRLPYRHEAELNALIAAQGDPQSRYFRRYLTSQQFNAYFGPGVAEVSAVQRVLQGAGFSVVRTRAGGQVIDVVAPARTVDRFFATQTHAVSQAGGGLRYFSARPPEIPASLQGRVAVVDGFSNVDGLRSPRLGAIRPSHNTMRPLDIPRGLIGPDGGFGVLAEAQVYDFPIRHGFRGDGWSVATVTDDYVKDSDVATYLRRFHQTRTGPRTQNIDVDGGCYRPFQCDQILPPQDAESIVGVATGITYYNYVVSGLQNAVVEDAFDQVVADNKADVVNFSLGECETDDPQFSTWVNAALKKGTAQGQTFVFASGEQQGGALGAYACNGNQPPPAPEAPTTGDYDLAVGGGDVIADGDRYISETGDLESGGGVSAIFPLSFQRGVPHIHPAGRNVPDVVAAAAIDGRGPSLYVQSYTGWVGGFTSVDAGPMAGFVATLDQMQGAREGRAVDRLYAGWKRVGDVYHGKTLFHDIVAGCNGIPGGGPPPLPGFCAHTGYDLVTGIGSIDGFNLAVAAGGTP